MRGSAGRGNPLCAAAGEAGTSEREIAPVDLRVRRHVFFCAPKKLKAKAHREDAKVSRRLAKKSLGVGPERSAASGPGPQVFPHKKKNFAPLRVLRAFAVCSCS